MRKRSHFVAILAAFVVSIVVVALTHSRNAAWASFAVVYIVEMLRPDTPREAVTRRIQEKEAEQRLVCDVTTNKWHWLSDEELREREEILK